MFLGNWGRLKRQMRYLQSLPNERLLAAIGVDLSEPTSVTRLVQRMQQALADTTKTPNIISLTTIPEYLQWHTTEKLDTIMNSFKLGRKFAEGLQAFATAQAIKPMDFLVSLGLFNDRWNTATLGKPLATAATEVKLRQLGCFDEHDVWDDAKARVVFQHIIDRDQAWLDEVVTPKPASTADKLKGRDQEF